MDLNDLVIGKGYNKSEIMDAFKFSDFHGISYSKETNTLILIFNHNLMYDDSWEGDVLYFTGTGRFGHQQLNGTNNRILYESDTNGVNIHLFEVFEEGVYTYQGEVELAGDPYKDIQPDANGIKREVWMFPLTKK
ncbi:hypothetical protein [uncultured Methanobrevibacter sp.]|uniref:hypothetical protein n=1 Tax=uncultured Methanobrevibacter sp. TaxID=253161 RepID=UPI00260817B3|nr:hypothetical protein [uncultured Methanobrevibacter sp.]